LTIRCVFRQTGFPLNIFERRKSGTKSNHRGNPTSINLVIIFFYILTIVVRTVKVFWILITILKPPTSRLLKPKNFFLKKHILQFPPKLTLQLDQNIVMAILQLIINTFQSSMNLLFPFNNTPKCIFISIYYLVFGSRILKFQGIWNA